MLHTIVDSLPSCENMSKTTKQVIQKAAIRQTMNLPLLKLLKSLTVAMIKYVHRRVKSCREG